jgi:(1->4)-alpha-D-glucan 1-alpha-D-glucosylmutase
LIAAAGRFFMTLGVEKTKPTGPEVWGDSALMLRRDVPRNAYRDVFSGRIIDSADRNGRQTLPLAEIFAHLPVALLESVA